MSNYTKNNVRRSITHIDETDYWDMHVNYDNIDDLFSKPDECVGTYIDTSNPKCVDGNNLYSLSEYYYINACNKGLKLENIGLTGVDNGLIQYRKDRISNDEFYELYTKSIYEIESGDTRLHLHQVSGNTQLYEYPTSFNEDGSIKLNGGFYQGFFRSGDAYSVLPSTIDNEWTLSFKIRKYDYEKESDKTLNDKNPNNKGIFFYIGTRAENKWVYLYDNIPLSGTSFGDCDYDPNEMPGLFEEEKPISAYTFDTTTGFDVSSPNDEYTLSDNKFLIFSRAKDGVTINDYTGDEVVMISDKKSHGDLNLFLYMNRTPSGYTVNDIEQIESAYTETYDNQKLYNDIYNNAFALLINDDGSIGYRYLVKSCSGDTEWHYEILSGNSYPNIVKEGVWTNVIIKIRSSKNGMKLLFYIDGKLKFITKELPSLNLHQLDELDEKQEGVAYNISIGGGTQGLSETIMPDYMMNPTKTFPLEENFAGTFIGDIKEFKLYTC